MIYKILHVIFLIMFSLFLWGRGAYAQIDWGKIDKIYNKTNIDEAKKYQFLTYLFYQNRYYISSLYFAEKHMLLVDSIEPKFEKVLENLYLKAGDDSFANMELGKIVGLKSPTLSVALGLELFKRKNYKDAYEILKQIPMGHKFSPESEMALGTIANLQNKDDIAFTHYDRCQKVAQKYEKKSLFEKSRRYYAIIRETCLIHSARVKYKKEELLQAMAVYESIPKRSYLWPYILLEKAWGHYNQNNFNKTLGLLVTYKSPLLKNYFLPEAEVLTALAYFRLCLWKDSMEVVNRFYNFYRPQSDSLISELNKHKNEPEYFLQLALSGEGALKKENIYIQQLITTSKKKIKYSLDITSLKMAQGELEKISKEKKSPLILDLQKNLEKMVYLKKSGIEYFLREEIYNFVNEIHRFAYEMFNIKLEIMSKQRTLVYNDKELVSDRSRGDWSNLQTSADDDFWSFNGAFWADELGDYSFGLKSNCEIVESESAPASRRRR
ncbi:MAG: hypothetical protein A2504_04400 [Bdellovibrionales bacterium RIFOXYD12_FULL_39_22]|nr:MAG: hypothetical protein A2385_07425 [Bdellovibrionales bacterium RIFOXYB1_FULL_39_21]OFZ42090.1 MAG: hypothetical protein A2485_09395 [Bdellovibrionales bacterium RIFOXYC12_FULL_39_17]OFZ50806.1 MAG: hypothetical protein A2404_06345 [Bdellovibrionales bacterium RIFOXYC1_FULL_39_130]OFZ78029.1 MAG: hypothetical protein A2560_01515 [Bdellovibrionales bacterium RIFOXYD1_FULL_39_84]OFZ93535.1 MAG: hypothetical protein A2504_04400 [Bdellovibrionales bacterium RIFOXYD12_FULL_39_22]HLE10343.1 hy